VQAANKALDKYPKSTSALKAKALGLLFSNSLDEARSTVDNMLSVSPDDIDVLAIKSMILSDQGHPDESELCLKKLVERSDKRPLFFLAKGKLASQRNETEEAIKSFEQALAGDQSLLVVHSCLADAFIKAGRFEDALSEAKECQRVPGLKALGVDYEAKAKEGMNQK
jgi:predicted Zn-dependent protease